MGQDTKRLAAEAWVEVREPLDRQLSPLGLQAVAALAPRPGETVLDVGCGTGESVLQLAERVGPDGHVIGVDISPRVLGVARERARGLQSIRFIEADAATLDLPDGGLDAVFSRFGVMAFAHADLAFCNFRRMLRDGGRLAFVCWRSLAENELDLLPLRAAGLQDRLDPTPFSFERPDHIRETLAGAGFHDIAVRSDDRTVTAGDLETTLAVLLKVGPLGKILRERPELRADAESRVRAELAGRGGTADIALRTATWIVTARA